MVGMVRTTWTIMYTEFCEETFFFFESCHLADNARKKTELELKLIFYTLRIAVSVI
jgi:hypothetical protein